MTQIGTVYGHALYELAKAEGLERRVLDQMELLEECFRKEPDFLRLLVAPHLTKVERCCVIDRCFRDKVELYLLNFLKILTEKGMIRSFPDCCRAFRQQYRADHGILTATAVTAVELTAKQMEKLRGKLSRLTGKRILLTNRVEPGVLGGVRLEFDGRCMDGTLAHGLEVMEKMLKGGRRDEGGGNYKAHP